jgi:hypothetical protein
MALKEKSPAVGSEALLSAQEKKGWALPIPFRMAMPPLGFVGALVDRPVALAAGIAVARLA